VRSFLANSVRGSSRRGLRRLSVYYGVNGRLRLELHPGHDPMHIEAKLFEVWGITVQVNCHLSAPLPDLLSDWVNTFGPENTTHGLAALRAALGLR
jgi:hypothetical protein